MKWFFCCYKEKPRSIELSTFDALYDRTLENTPKFTFKGERLHTKVLDVIDGDTITISIRINGEYKCIRARLIGVDAPEIRTLDIEEKKLGYEARDWLRKEILNNVVWVECGDWDSFGRILVVVYKNHINMKSGHSVNTSIIEAGYAKPYRKKSSY